MSDKQLKKVNIGWQCLASAFFPTGLYAFKRINKLRQGILIYGITIMGSLITTIIPYFYWAITLGNVNNVSSNDVYDVFNVISIAIIASSIIIPIIFMSRWSNEWNESINGKNEIL